MLIIWIVFDILRRHTHQLMFEIHGGGTYAAPDFIVELLFFDGSAERCTSESGESDLFMGPIY